MTKYENILIDEEDQHDLFVCVGFEQNLSPNEIVDVIQLITETVTSYEATALDFTLLGISFLEIDNQKLQVKLRFEIGDTSLEEIQHQKANFVMHLIAIIDAKYPLSDTPFPETFRQLLNLRDYYGLNE